MEGGGEEDGWTLEMNWREPLVCLGGGATGSVECHMLRKGSEGKRGEWESGKG